MDKIELEIRYPNLYFSDDTRAVWVKRDGRDGEAIAYHLPAQDELERLNREAGLALQDGWFFCSEHLVAHPRSEYGFFYFAGVYCKQVQEQEPDLYRRAMNESYN